MTGLGNISLPFVAQNSSINFTNAMDSGDNDTDEYDYEYEDPSIPAPELAAVSIFYSLTLLLGVVGNVLVIFSILRYRRMQNVTNAFLTSLATADLFLVLLCVPIKFAKWFSFTWKFGWFLCKGVHYLQNVSVICSVLTLTAMSMERYYAILHPMRARYTCTLKRARRVCLVVWFLSFVLAIPTILIQRHMEVGVKHRAHWCINWCMEGHACEDLYYKIYAVYMLILVLILPLAIMTFAYSSICRELWIVTSARKKMRSGVSGTEAERETCCVSTSNLVSDKTTVYPKQQKLSVDDDSTRKQVIKMLVAVIVLFAVCWGPTLVDHVLVAFSHSPELSFGTVKYLRQTFAVMSYFNSCVNPIVYAFMSRNFRETFKYALCSCIHGKDYMRSRHYTRQTSQGRDTSFSMTRTISIKNDMETEACDLRYDGDAYRSFDKDEPL